MPTAGTSDDASPPDCIGADVLDLDVAGALSHTKAA